ncbi:MAG: phosphatase PAP2 family protein [Gammaproteobacteria bacterium]
MNNHLYRNYFFSLIAIAIVYAISYFYLDIPLAYAAHSLHGSILFKVSKYITDLGEDEAWLVIALIGFVLIGMQYYQKRKLSFNSQRVGYVFLNVFVAIAVGTVLKIILARYRPEMLFTQGLYGFHFFSLKNALYSTPSGHSLTIFAICASLSILFRRYASIFYVIAILIGISRLILTKHYLSDVILGAYIGIMSAVIIHGIFKIKGLNTNRNHGSNAQASIRNDNFK